MNWLSTHWRGIFAISIFITGILHPAAWYCAKRPPSPPEPCSPSAITLSDWGGRSVAECRPGTTMRLVDDRSLVLCECPGTPPSDHRGDGGTP